MWPLVLHGMPISLVFSSNTDMVIGRTWCGNSGINREAHPVIWVVPRDITQLLSRHSNSEHTSRSLFSLHMLTQYVRFAQNETRKPAASPTLFSYWSQKTRPGLAFTESWSCSSDIEAINAASMGARIASHTGSARPHQRASPPCYFYNSFAPHLRIKHINSGPIITSGDVRCWKGRSSCM